MPSAPGDRWLSLFIPWIFIATALVLGSLLRPVTLPAYTVQENMPSQLPVGAMLLVPWALGLAILTRGAKGFQLVPVFRPTHALPAVLQAIIFAYWCVYWAPVRQHLAAIVFQLLFAYAFDALLSQTTRRRWEVGLGPIPIVLSTNLFAQFSPGVMDASLVMIAVGLLSKALIQVKGRHIFNPSAFGITIVGVFWLAAGFRPQGDVSSQLNLAPNMAELLLVIGVVVQLRVRTALLTGFAAIGLIIGQSVTGLRHFSPMWPPVLIVITLLATDPASTPATGPGRALGGLALGFFMPMAGWATDAITGGWDFYGKVMLIPLLNLFAPSFDRMGKRLPLRLGRVLDLEFTRAHVVIWFLLGSWLVATSGPKMHQRELELHETEHTALIIRNEDGSVSCERNPVFCKPFTMLDEASLWWHAR